MAMIRLPRNAQIWLPGYCSDRLRALGRPSPSRVWVAITDHYEPLWRGADETSGRARVAEWRKRWPEIARRHSDSRNGPPRYSFFYPEDEYRPFFLDPLAEMVGQGNADVEVHIHHDDGPHGPAGRQRFIDRMAGFLETLSTRHGLLRRWNERVAFGFIHGNWALDNSRPDGRWCGINDELRLLGGMGCYADFTMPSGASPTQASMVNQIYWAQDRVDRPKSYDQGTPLRPGEEPSGDLLMIPGPFGLRWAGRLVPRMECGELAHYDPPDAYRVRRWIDLGPRIGTDVFVKLFTHGAQEDNLEMLLGGGLDAAFKELGSYCDQLGAKLYYVSAWQMFQAIEALRCRHDPADTV